MQYSREGDKRLTFIGKEGEEKLKLEGMPKYILRQAVSGSRISLQAYTNYLHKDIAITLRQGP